MIGRTDLAIEEKTEENGIKILVEENDGVKFSKIEISDEKTAEKLSKRIGKYITVEFPDLEKTDNYEPIKVYIKKGVEMLTSGAKKFLVVGLGNREITADSIGPITAEKLLATRHIAGDFAEKIGLTGLRSTAVCVPNVLGKTGIEAAETVEAIVKKVKPDAVIVIDALASLSIDRLFKTIQITDSGISPGSGVKNSRKELSFKTLNVPVIAIGIPTVVDAMQLAFELTGKQTKTPVDLVVTPKDSDLLTHRLSEILAESLNLFLQPEIDREVLFSLV